MTDESTSHLTSELLTRWRQGALSGAETLAVSDHLAACVDCREQAMAEPSRRLASGMRRLLEADPEAAAAARHATTDELVAWWDDSLEHAECEWLRRHLDGCPACRLEADDLAAFAARDAPAGRPRWRSMLAVAAALVALLTAAAALRWLGRPASQHPVQSAATPAVTAAVVGPAPPTAMGTPSEPALVDGPLRFAADGAVSGVPRAWDQRLANLVREPRLVAPEAALAIVRGYESQRTTEGLGGEEPVTPLYPLSRIVLEDRPAFRWRAQGQAVRIEVFDEDLDRIAVSDVLDGDEWRPLQPLPRGEVLTWRVVVPGEGELGYPAPPNPPAVFQIASAAAAAEAAAARQTGSRLLTALALWRAGVLEPAVAELTALQRDNPQSTLARSLADSARAELKRVQQVGLSARR